VLDLIHPDYRETVKERIRQVKGDYNLILKNLIGESYDNFAVGTD
jgi:hypothetical protein